MEVNLNGGIALVRLLIGNSKQRCRLRLAVTVALLAGSLATGAQTSQSARVGPLAFHGATNPNAAGPAPDRAAGDSSRGSTHGNLMDTRLIPARDNTRGQSSTRSQDSGRSAADGFLIVVATVVVAAIVWMVLVTHS
jgi:hypothetical protein